jgi:hypothetical protein
MAFLTIWRHARARAITRDTVLPANLCIRASNDASRDVGRVVSDVSVLCPRVVDANDNKPALTVRLVIARCVTECPPLTSSRRLDTFVLS